MQLIIAILFRFNSINIIISVLYYLYMQPEGRNYWKNDSPEDDSAEQINDMYVPEAEVEEQQPTGVYEKPVHQKTGDEPVHWSASEYVHAEKNALWFVAFVFVVLAFIAADILLIKSYTFSVLVVVMAVSIVVYSKRPPRMVEYTLSGDQGLYIGETLHHFTEFKAFGLINDKGSYSIMLIPTKRFAPGVSVYFPEEVGEKIVDILGARLPMKPLKLDAVDVIIRKLRL